MKNDYTQYLKQKIKYLEERKAKDLLLLKAQLLISLESIKPANIIKDSFNDLATDAKFQEDFIKTTLSTATGYVVKKMVEGDSDNPVRHLFGTLLQIGVTNVVSKNSEGIKSTFLSVFNSFFSKNEKRSE